jgi:HemY protein
MMLAKAALSARDFAAARAAMAPLIDAGQRPTGRMCLILAEIEDLENGAQGLVREWLARGARAPRGPAWMADGVVADVWAPVSPVTGKLDAFRWGQDAEQISGPVEDTQAARSLDGETEKSAPDLALSAPLETQAEAVAAPAPNAEAEPPKPPMTPQPVIFPLAAAPDDPGPRSPEEAAARRF